MQAFELSFLLPLNTIVFHREFKTCLRSATILSEFIFTAIL